MEFVASKKGDLRILTVRGPVQLQNWRMLDDRLRAMMDDGSRWVALDLSGVTLICSTGIGSIMHNVRKFQEREASLLLVATTPYVQELFQLFGFETFLGDSFFADWRSLEKRLHSQGLALKG